jgi:hypothetical protein
MKMEKIYIKFSIDADVIEKALERNGRDVNLSNFMQTKEILQTELEHIYNDTVSKDELDKILDDNISGGYMEEE